jgi:hypothetical protein
MRKSKFSEHGIIAIRGSRPDRKERLLRTRDQGSRLFRVEVEVRQFCYLALAGVTQMGEVIPKRF